MKLSNNTIHQLINLCTYWLTNLRSKIEKKDTFKNHAPLFVTGMFRSGTTLTTNILIANGFHAGPESDLLAGVGTRKNINPTGFAENYLFMDLSLYIFSKLNSWGDRPPTTKELHGFKIGEISNKDFRYFSIVNIHDDRISNKSKMKLLSNYCPHNIQDYLSNEFKVPFLIKNPHFAVMHELFISHFPKAQFLVVFRNPETTVESAKKVTPNATYELYIKYYENLIADLNTNISYFCYENLVLNPEKSITAIIQKYNLTNDKKEESKKIIDKNRAKGLTIAINTHWPEELKRIYSVLLKRAINS